MDPVLTRLCDGEDKRNNNRISKGGAMESDIGAALRAEETVVIRAMGRWDRFVGDKTRYPP